MRSCADSLSFVLLLLMLAPGAALAAADPPVPASLAARVAAHVAAAWHVAADAVRLDWPRTGPPPDLPADAPFRLVGKARDGWFVVRFEPAAGPVVLRVRAGVDDTVQVAARPLASGSCITVGDLRREPRRRWGPPVRPADDPPGEGWEVRRPLAEGEVVGWPAVLPPPLVAAGQPVRLTWCRGGVDVMLAGIALNAARRGEMVRARVEGRSGPLIGTVTGPGTAVLGMGGEP